MTLALRNGALAAVPGSTTPIDIDGALLPYRTDAGRVPIAAPAIHTRRASGPVCDDDRLSSLIGDIYDAALDPGLWPCVLKQSVDFIGGMAGALFYKDAAAKHGNVYYEYGTDPHYKRLYFESYVKIDPTSVGHCFAEVGKPMGMRDIMDADEFRATRFYQEWVRPQQSGDNVSVALDKSATGAALFAVFTHERQGLADADMYRRMALIGPHVRRAALVGRALEHKTAEAATLADTLDGIGAAMLLVDADARVVHANAAGEAMLREGVLLSATSRRLAAADAQASRALTEAIAAAKDGDAALGSRGIAVPLTARDGERYVVHVLPLTSAERRGAQGGQAAVAALLVQRVALRLQSVPEVVARTFKLTPTELRVLLGVVEMGGVPETAEALGIGQATVKTHLHRVFGKTDTRRQADLVKLVAGFANPLAG